MGRAKPTSPTKRTAESRVKMTAAPPMTEPICFGRFSSRYRAMRTVTPIAS